MEIKDMYESICASYFDAPIFYVEMEQLDNLDDFSNNLVDENGNKSMYFSSTSCEEFHEWKRRKVHESHLHISSFEDNTSTMEEDNRENVLLIFIEEIYLKHGKNIQQCWSIFRTNFLPPFWNGPSMQNKS